MAKHGGSHRAVLPQGCNGGDLIRWKPVRIHACSIGTTGDGAMEDALYEIASMRLLPGYPWIAPAGPHPIMNFRHLLEQHQLARQLFKTINRWLAEAGVMMTQGTLSMPPSLRHPARPRTRQQRDPEMHQTKKGNQWHFG
ncbi:hypothetical protein AWN70_25120 [Escherichia coli]|nr:hypothetical protein AWN70_25120 [Escherichia coli]